MKILLVSPFPPYIGGVSISSERLYRCLKRDGIEVQKYDIRFKNKVLNSWRFLKILRFALLPLKLQKFDIIHFHVSGVYPKLYISVFRKLISRDVKFIITIHGEVKNLLKHKLGYKSLSGFDAIICTNPGDSSYLDGKSKQKVYEIPAYIHPSIQNDTRLPPTIEKFLDFSGFKFVVNGAVICNGQFEDLYGFRDTLELVKLLKDEISDFKLLLINLGNKSGKKGLEFIAYLKNFVIQNELENRVVFYEGQPLDFSLILKHVNLYIRPTKTDGDSLSIREALALKVPTIASDVVDRPRDTILYSLERITDLREKVLLVHKNNSFYINEIKKTSDYYSHILNVYDNLCKK